MTKNVILYTQPDCPPCQIVKLYLQDKKVTYTEKNIKTDSNARNELMNKYQSYSTPTIVVEDIIITGFDLEALDKALF